MRATPPSTLLRLTALATAAALGTLLSGCSSLDGWLAGDKVDYRSATPRTKGLEVPPDLTQLARDNRYQQPGGVVSAAGIAQAPSASVAAPAAAQTVAVTAVGDIRVERQGNQRWLVVPQAPERVFTQARAFWIERGFTIASENAEAGLMETDWAENRAKIPMDFIRSAIGRILDRAYDSGERDRFRTRIERAPGGGSEIYISHRGMEEVYTTSQKDSTVWQPRASDPQLEAEFLSRLMVKLGGGREETARTMVASAPDTPARARVVGGQAAATLEVDEPFDRAWRRIGLALDRRGFTVEDRDRTAGLYFVRYADPARPAAGATGFFSRIFGGKSDEGSPAVRYRISVVGQGTERTRAMVLGSGGSPDAGPTGQRIVTLLADELR